MKNKKIYYTEDYSLFNLIKVNRDVNPKKAPAKKLLSLMKKHGFNPSWPIICKKQDERGLLVMDGQHRLYFAQKLGIGVWYVIDETSMDISDHNSASQNWTTKDHILRWYKAGLNEYVKAVEFSQKNNISLTTSASILAGTMTVNNVKNAIVEGKYVVKNERIANSIAKCLKVVRKTGEITNSNSAISAIYAMHYVDYFDAKDFMDKIETNPGLLVNYGDRDGFLDLFDEVYNYRKRDKVPLAFDAKKAMKERNATS